MLKSNFFCLPNHTYALTGTYDIISNSESTKNVGQLHVRLEPVSDREITGMEEAVAEAPHPSVAFPPPTAVQALSDTISDICGKLKSLQDLDDELSEVGY
jgi:hypothetical protein